MAFCRVTQVKFWSQPCQLMGRRVWSCPALRGRSFFVKGGRPWISLLVTWCERTRRQSCVILRIAAFFCKTRVAARLMVGMRGAQTVAGACAALRSGLLTRVFGRLAPRDVQSAVARYAGSCGGRSACSSGATSRTRAAGSVGTRRPKIFRRWSRMLSSSTYTGGCGLVLFSGARPRAAQRRSTRRRLRSMMNGISRTWKTVTLLLLIAALTSSSA